MCLMKLANKRKERQTAMNKLTNIVHSGWMIKSPPEQKLQSPLKFFRARWKQRFFVLHKPTGSLPDQYELSYYGSENCSRKKGSIDLDQCDQIIESLDSDQYPHLLAIKTVCRGKVRTYYLATTSEESMTAWVQCLCRVCGLKQEDTPTDIPDARLDPCGPSALSSTKATGHTQIRETTTKSAHHASSTVISQPPQSSLFRAATVPTSTPPSGSQPVLSSSPQSYYHLNDCTTGTPGKHNDQYVRTDSVDSAPEYQAPSPPPLKKRSARYNNNNDEDFKSGLSQSSRFDEVYDRPPTAVPEIHRPRSGLQETYDRPRSGEVRGLPSDDAYKVPPSSSGVPTVSVKGAGDSVSMDIDLNSAVPLPRPHRSPQSPHGSVRPESVDSLGQLTESYDVPPSSQIIRPVEAYDVPPPGFSDQRESYDVPPSGLPERPSMETYNIPPAVSSCSRPVSENYDFPPSRPSVSKPDKGSSMSIVSTPPQRPPKPQSMYTSMASKGGKSREVGGLSAVPSAPSSPLSSGSSYDIPRPCPVVSPPRETSTILDIAPPRLHGPRGATAGGGQAYQNAPPVMPPMPEIYHRNGHKHTERHGRPSDRDSENVYQVPPVAPQLPARSTMPTANTGAISSVTGPESEEMEAHYIWSNTRTKSFKRNHQVNINNKAAPARSHIEQGRTPQGRPPLPLRSTEFASSSEDDDDASVDGSEIQTHVVPSAIHMSLPVHMSTNVRMSTPVPISSEHELEPELKYLDLDLDAHLDPSRTQHVASSHGKATEYREIDFDKTQALQDAKRVRRLDK